MGTEDTAQMKGMGHIYKWEQDLESGEQNNGFPPAYDYRSGTVNSKSFVGKVFLRIKWKFELN